jgi:hypothetical protein
MLAEAGRLGIGTGELTELIRDADRAREGLTL